MVLCPGCSQTFERIRSTQIYCRPSCHVRHAHRERQRDPSLFPSELTFETELPPREFNTARRRVDLAHVDDLAAGLSLRQRIRSAVIRQPQTLASLAEQLSANVESLNRTVRKHRDTFTRVTGSDGVARIALVERGTS